MGKLPRFFNGEGCQHTFAYSWSAGNLACGKWHLPAPGIPLSQSNGFEQKSGSNHLLNLSSLSNHWPVPGYSDLAFSQPSWIVSELAGDSHCRTFERRRSRSASLTFLNSTSAIFRTLWTSSNSMMPAWLSISILCCFIFCFSPSILELKPLHDDWKSFSHSIWILSRQKR